MKPLGIDMWWIIKSITTVSFDKWWRKEVFQRFLMSLTKAENQDTLPPQPIRLGLNRRRVFYPWKAVYTSSAVNRGKSGIYLFLRKYSTYLANSVYFLILVDLIQVFRIRGLLCNLINIRTRHEPRVRFWTEECSFVLRLFMLIQITCSFQFWLSVFSFSSALLSVLSSFEWLLSHCLAHELIISLSIVS